MRRLGGVVAAGFGLVWSISALAQAESMRATLYDDGLACPGGCDAHVVFAPQHNGTRNAFLPPLSERGAPKPCVAGSSCMICFEVFSTRGCAFSHPTTRPSASLAR